ncbi:MAG TPA: hypothetical protein VN448_12205, partial [Gammaproteobacteria bacterium]|nr:hypothetical protein [Gammaproteobacteria bacterium]
LAALPLSIYVLMGMLLFEGITNWRVPALVSRLRSGSEPTVTAVTSSNWVISFEAERALRLILVAMLGLSLLLEPQLVWWLPWFIAFALIGAGLSGICPMVSALRWVGMR